MGKLAANETASVTTSLQANTQSQQIALLQRRANDADEHAQVRPAGVCGAWAGGRAGGRGPGGQGGGGGARAWHGRGTGVERGWHGGGTGVFSLLGRCGCTYHGSTSYHV
jgi:hypothetical protein